MMLFVTSLNLQVRTNLPRSVCGFSKFTSSFETDMSQGEGFLRIRAETVAVTSEQINNQDQAATYDAVPNDGEK